MRKRFFALVVKLMVIAVVILACTETPPRRLADRQREISRGEKVFQEKECAKCHTTSGEFAKADTAAPDLASVFLAMDTLFVRTHLKFTELSKMPPIEMTSYEINALVQYIASLHAKANADPNLKDPDGICPVCGAPLKISEAEANHLVASYAGKKFYFECPDCKVVFERDPAWHSQSGYL
jgi:mono/diheme cytochrome c family protein/YHS domain-containing protein